MFQSYAQILEGTSYFASIPFDDCPIYAKYYYCIYIYIYADMYIYIYTYIYICRHVCMYIYIYVNLFWEFPSHAMIDYQGLHDESSPSPGPGPTFFPGLRGAGSAKPKLARSLRRFDAWPFVHPRWPDHCHNGFLKNWGLSASRYQIVKHSKT